MTTVKLRLIVLCGIAAGVLLVTPPQALAQRFELQPATIGPTGAGSAQASPGFAAARDFATEVIGDPWDFEQATDYNYMYSLEPGSNRPAWVSMPTFADGYFHGISQSNTPKLSMQFEGVSIAPGALNAAFRTGVRYPIDANTYRRLSFRIRRSVGFAATELLSALWFTATYRSENDYGVRYFTSMNFNEHVGRYENQMPLGSQGRADEWQIYKVDLTQAPTALFFGKPWQQTVRGFEFTVGNGAHVNRAAIDVDWVRLYEPGTAMATLSFSGFTSGNVITLTARHTETNDTIQIYPDNGTSETKFANGTFPWDYGFLPPGTWTITATGLNTSNQIRTVTQTLVIDAPPVLTVLEPDVKGGRDFARAVIGDAWDLSNVEDVTRYGRLQQITNPVFGNSGLSGGTTGGAGTGTMSDASVIFLDDAGKAPGTEFLLDADTYYRLSFTLEYTDRKDLTGPESLGTEWGGVFRVIWRPPHAPSYTDMKTPMMMDGGPQDFALDMRELTMTGPMGEPGLEPHSQYLWQGKLGTFRIDIDEGLRPRTFTLSNVRLAADDEPNGNGFFVIRWRTPDATLSRGLADAAGSDATVKLYWDVDRNAANGRTLIAQNIGAGLGASLVERRRTRARRVLGLRRGDRRGGQHAGTLLDRASATPCDVRAADRQRRRRHGRRLGGEVRRLVAGRRPGR